MRACEGGKEEEEGRGATYLVEHEELGVALVQVILIAAHLDVHVVDGVPVCVRVGGGWEGMREGQVLRFPTTHTARQCMQLVILLACIYPSFVTHSHTPAPPIHQPQPKDDVPLLPLAVVKDLRVGARRYARQPRLPGLHAVRHCVCLGVCLSMLAACVSV